MERRVIDIFCLYIYDFSAKEAETHRELNNKVWTEPSYTWLHLVSQIRELAIGFDARKLHYDSV